MPVPLTPTPGLAVAAADEINQCFHQPAHAPPVLPQGDSKCNTWSDDWTVTTKDGGLAAQYEHTLLIVPSGVEILTTLQ